MRLARPGPPDSSPEHREPPPFAETLRSLRPISEVASIGARVLEDMGLGEASAVPCTAEVPTPLDFSVLHFVVLPQQSVWLDFALEAGRAPLEALHQAILGSDATADADLEDLLRETMNLIHGALKLALKGDGLDVLIPVVPLSIARDAVSHVNGGLCVQRRHILSVGTIALRLTMIARFSPVLLKPLRDFDTANVLAEPLVPGTDDGLILIQRGTMLDTRVMRKVRALAEFDDGQRTHAVIEPSPLARQVHAT